MLKIGDISLILICQLQVKMNKTLHFSLSFQFLNLLLNKFSFYTSKIFPILQIILKKPSAKFSQLQKKKAFERISLYELKKSFTQNEPFTENPTDNQVFYSTEKLLSFQPKVFHSVQ